VPRLEVRQARDEPARGERGVGAQADDVVRILARDGLGGGRDLAERGADAARVALAHLGQAHAHALAREELHPQVFLQHRHLAAHGRLAHVELAGREREVAGARDDLEDLEGVERGDFHQGAIVPHQWPA